MDLDNTMVLRLKRPEQLVHACLRAFQRFAVPAVRWVQDAAMIAGCLVAEDWDSLTQLADAGGTGSLLYPALDCLNGVAPGTVPALVLSVLRRRPASLNEKMLLRLADKPTVSRIDRLWLERRRFPAVSCRESGALSVWAFFRYLQHQRRGARLSQEGASP